ncbi:MAG: uroporphyrinogen decarboxylase family protein [Spirochaetaceae bacterium]|jgi:uroporphyrinogen decarboxylase|nr:uroporphyrinogen decarboxylase family protein [Spirochaetaceae bacterium]
MTPREVILAAAAGNVPDRLPVVFSPQGILRARQGLSVEQFYRLPPEEQARFRIDGMRAYGGDVLPVGYNGTLAVLALGGSVKFRARGAPDVMDPLITGIADLDRIDLARIRTSFYYLSDLAVARLIADRAGNEYALSAGSWGPFTMAGLLAGTDTLMRKCIRDKAAVRDLLDFSLEMIKIYSEEFFDLGIDIGTIAEPSASQDMISRRVFEEFALPWLRKTFDWYQSKGLIPQLHICGDITDRLSAVGESGARILSLDHKVNMKTAAETLGGKLILGGNADPVEVIMSGSAESVREAYRNIVREVAGYPYILMPGCDVPSKTPLENAAALREFARTTPPPWKAV